MIKHKIKLGEFLVSKNIITEEQLQKALEEQKNLKENGKYKKLGELIVELGFADEKEILKALSEYLEIDFIDLYNEKIDYDLLSSFPLSMLVDNLILPFKMDENYVYIATSEPLNYDVIEMIERILNKPSKVYIAFSKDIIAVLENLKKYLKARELIKKIKEDLSESAGVISGAIDEFVDFLLKDAIDKRCTDVHIEPQKYNFLVRGRIDGVLHELFSFDLEIYFPLVSKIKLLANLDISEKRKPQDGRFTKTFDNKTYDFRVSTAPVLHGESVVLRILDQQRILLTMDKLGMSEYNLKRFEYLIKSPYGIVFVTGPTGSGKTTTLYAALNEIKGPDKKIITIEDPVEYELSLIQQIPVNYKIGLTFASVIKNILRQDPDVIMIGEIRDSDTLSSAIQASLTGHLVLGTLHTNDSISTITRLEQMGAERYMVSESMLGAVAQRLIRKICPHCKHKYYPKEEELKWLKPYLDENMEFYKGLGCKYCNFTGYLGREMISEVFIVNSEIQKLINEGADRSRILEAAKKSGFVTMIEDGVNKLKLGITTIEEILRVVKVDTL